MVRRGLSIGLVPVARPRRIVPPAGETTLAFRYLYIFRRVVVSLALVGAVLAWAAEFRALTAALVCVGIGEWLESSYYIGVLRWRGAQIRGGNAPAARCPGVHESAAPHQGAALSSSDRPLVR